MRIVAILSLALGLALILSCAGRQDPCKNFLNANTPQTLDEALDTLTAKLAPETIADIQSSEESDMSQYHFGLGMGIRNCWNLWSGGPLYEYFENLGLFHPDDMSEVILTSLWRRLHKQPLNVEEQIKHYQEYWRVMTDPDPKSNPHCPTGIITTLSGTPEAVESELRGVHMGKCCPDGKVWAYHVDKGWYIPDSKLINIWNAGHGYDPCKEK